jgi:hypothetical protein
MRCSTLSMPMPMPKPAAKSAFSSRGFVPPFCRKTLSSLARSSHTLSPVMRLRMNPFCAFIILNPTSRARPSWPRESGALTPITTEQGSTLCTTDEPDSGRVRPREYGVISQLLCTQLYSQIILSGAQELAYNPRMSRPNATQLPSHITLNPWALSLSA